MGIPIPPDLQKAADADLMAKSPEQEKHEEDEAFAERLFEQLLIRYEDPHKYIEILMSLCYKTISGMMNSAMSIDTLGPLAKSVSVSSVYSMWQYELGKCDKNVLGVFGSIISYIVKSNPELEPQMRVTKENVAAMNKLFHSKEGGPFGKEKAPEESYKD